MYFFLFLFVQIFKEISKCFRESNFSNLTLKEKFSLDFIENVILTVKSVYEKFSPSNIDIESKTIVLEISANAGKRSRFTSIKNYFTCPNLYLVFIIIIYLLALLYLRECPFLQYPIF